MKEPKVSLGLVNPKSPENVGAVLRAAANYGIDNVFYTGDRYPRAIERKARTVDMSRKVSMGVKITQKNCLLDDVPEEMKVICVEFVLNATPLPEYEHPENALYIFLY